MRVWWSARSARSGAERYRIECELGAGGIATVYLDQGDDARAEAYFIKADAVCTRAGVDRDSLVVLPFLC